MDALPAPRPRRSFFAYASALLGVLSLLAVLCFHYPQLLTSKEFRAVYNEGFARHLLLLGLVAAFILGTLAILRDRNKRIATLGVGAATLAVLFGGTNVQFDRIGQTPYSLGLDWFVISLFFSALVFVPLERYLGQRRISPLRAGWRTDIAYFFMSHVLVQFILILVTASTSQIAGLAAFPALKAAIQSLPVWAQFLIAVFVADLAQALLHRAYHNVPWLWRFHAVHHSSREMDWLAGSRIHFVEIVMTRSVVLPLLVLGFSAPAINAYVILVGLQAVLAHANLGIRFGWLEYVLVLPRYHHWHHARQYEYIDVNYAIHLPLVDMLMGTFKLPRERDAWPQEYGVMKLETVPRGIVRQHLMPFRRRKTFDDYVD